VTESSLLNVLPASVGVGMTADFTSFEDNPWTKMEDLFRVDMSTDLTLLDKFSAVFNEDMRADLTGVSNFPHFERPLNFSFKSDEVICSYVGKSHMPPLNPIPTLRELSQWTS